MSNLRAQLVALAIVALAIAPVLTPGIGPGSPGGLSAFAATVAGPAMQDDDDDGGDDDSNDDDSNGGDDEGG